jgi:cytochrome c peroxidase
VALGAALGGLSGISMADGTPFYANPFDKQPDAAALTAIGRELFSDPALSASGKMSCATCHDPKHAFGPPQGLSLSVRAVPSLMYAQNTPPFTEHFIDDEGDDSIDLGPAGGRTWDGRAQSLHEQARLPLFAPLEMANRDADAVVIRVQARYAAAFRRVFGEKIFDDEALAFKGVLMALEAFQQSPAEFYPYSSKYDAYLRHEATLSAQELKGLAAFNDPAKGNCARCHPSTIRQGAFPQFTDFGFAAIGVPRNLSIPANADRRYNDLGLCGPLRADLTLRPEYCGMFRTPTLRNAATRRVFFHNGVLHSLSDAVRFYAERDTKPARWYPRAGGGTVLKFDDLPPEYRANLDSKVPFDRRAGDAPALSEEDIADIVAFLETLTDGYR